MFKALLSHVVPEPFNVLMLGPDAAGKTTMHYVHGPPEEPQLPGVIGWNCENWADYKGLRITAWDTGGQEKIRPIWLHYYATAKSLLFVIDSNDPDRLDEVRDQLSLLLAEKLLEGVPIAVLANKQDLPQSMSTEALTRELELESLSPRLWRIFATVGTDRNHPGVAEACDWLRAACSSTASSPQSPQRACASYLPGEYKARTRLMLRTELPEQASHIKQSSANCGGYVERGITFNVLEVQDVHQRHYGRIEQPKVGWVLLGAPGCFQHVQQQEFVVTLICTTDNGDKQIVQCHTIAGEELLSVPAEEMDLESVGYFRAAIGRRICKSSSCLKVVMPDASLLPLHGSREDLFEALGCEDPLPMTAPEKPHKAGCIVQ